MTTPLDVLIVECHPGAGDTAALELEAAGHHVLRCYDRADRGFACLGLREPSRCPLRGPVDVAVLVRHRVYPRATPYEGGVVCARSRGVPIVECGSDILDPHEEWITTRVAPGGDLVAACEEVSQPRDVPMTRPEPPADASSQLEALTEAECLELIGGVGVGRFAVATLTGGLLVVPVNYVLDGEVIVFRTRLGAKVDGLRAAGLTERLAAFQVDAVDPFHRTGWSVLVQGIAYEATDEEVKHLGLQTWVGDPDRWVRLLPQSITGRRIQPTQTERDPRAYL